VIRPALAGRERSRYPSKTGRMLVSDHNSGGQRQPDIVPQFFSPLEPFDDHCYNSRSRPSLLAIADNAWGRAGSGPRAWALP